jgi:alkylated DNA repair dioxygenase AlkB
MRQAALFGAMNEPVQLVRERGDVTYYPAYVDFDEGDALISELLATTKFAADTRMMYGKRVAVPRETAGRGDRMSQPWTPLLQVIRHRIESLLDMEFDYVFVNKYRNGNDSVAWHGDHDGTDNPGKIIGSLSLGATREFDLRPKAESELRPRTIAIDVSHGDLIVMRGETRAQGSPRPRAAHQSHVPAASRAVVLAAARCCSFRPRRTAVERQLKQLPQFGETRDEIRRAGAQPRADGCVVHRHRKPREQFRIDVRIDGAPALLRSHEFGDALEQHDSPLVIIRQMRCGRCLHVAREDEFLQRMERQIGIGAPIAITRIIHVHQLVDEICTGALALERRERLARHEVEIIVENPQEQVALVGCVEEERARRDAGALRDFAHVGALVSKLGEHRTCRFADATPLVELAAFSPSDLHRGRFH